MLQNRRVTPMTARLHVDRQACAGHGLCYGVAPELLDSDEQGDPMITVDPVPDELESIAQEAVRSCPERALTVATASAHDEADKEGQG